MEIKGLGPASIKKMGITHPVDLYTPQSWHLLGANGSKIQDELERSCTKTVFSSVSRTWNPWSRSLNVARYCRNASCFWSTERDLKYQTITGVGPKNS